MSRYDIPSAPWHDGQPKHKSTEDNSDKPEASYQPPLLIIFHGPILLSTTVVTKLHAGLWVPDSWMEDGTMPQINEATDRRLATTTDATASRLAGGRATWRTSRGGWPRISPARVPPPGHGLSARPAQ